MISISLVIPAMNFKALQVTMAHIPMLGDCITIPDENWDSLYHGKLYKVVGVVTASSQSDATVYIERHVLK